MILTSIALILAGMSFGLLVSFGYRLMPLLFSRRNITLKFSPADMHIREVIIAILAMIVKSMVPISWTTWFAPAKLTLTAPFVMNEDHLAQYQIAIGKRNEQIKNVDPLHQLLYLSAITEPAMLLILASPACPMNPLGAVNVRNRFELLRPDLCVPTAFKSLGQARVTASVCNSPRPAKRGVEYDLEVCLSIQDQTNIGGTFPVFRQTFTMLEFRKAGNKPANIPERQESSFADSISQNSLTFEMQFQDNDPSRWARLCKDYNFIHFSKAAAKAIGFPGKIMHGNHSIARALQNVQAPSLGNAPTWMEVYFKRPMIVPAMYEAVTHDSEDNRHGFSVMRSGKVHAISEYGLLRRKQG